MENSDEFPTSSTGPTTIRFKQLKEKRIGTISPQIWLLSVLDNGEQFTHWQLLLNIHPLSSRFYQEMLEQVHDSPIGAYLKIDPRYRKHDPDLPKREDIYLEDILTLEEKLLNGRKIREELETVTARSDGTYKFTQSIEEAARELLSKTDLFQLPSLSSFLRTALEGFNHLIHKDASALHPSWFKEVLLLQAIAQGIPTPQIQQLIALGLDVGVMDKERRTTLRYAVDHNASPSLLSLLKAAYNGEQFHTWLNTVASDRLTALDVVLENKNLFLFKELIEYGASRCSPTIALKFYKKVIKNIVNNDPVKAAFLKLMQANDEVRWYICLEEMLPWDASPYQSGQLGEPILTATFSKRLLPNWVRTQILSPDHEWIPYTQEGSNHTVCRAVMPQATGRCSVQIQEQARGHAQGLVPGLVSGQAPGLAPEQALYVKVYPELPGIEQAVGLLTRMLLGYGAPHTELIKLHNTPVLLSQSRGDKTKTLEHILRTNPQQLNDLDDESLSGLILVAMLINPEDGKPSNYVIEDHPTKPGTYRIAGVDNDHAFVPAVVMEKPQKKLDISSLRHKPVPVAQVKTILYCLNQMKDSVHPNVRNLFINLRPDELLEDWLRGLKKINVSYNELFPDTNDHNRFFRENDCFLGVPFQCGAISHLYDKFVTLRDALSEFPNITHLDLLSRLEPLLAKKYQAASHFSSVKERWEKSDAGFYEKTRTGSGTTMTKSGDILRSMNIPLEESVFESIRKGKDSGPIQALRELEAIKAELTTQTLESLGAQAGDPNILKTLQLESTRAAFLEKTDFKNMPLKRQEAILSYLTTKKPKTLILKNCGALNDSILTTRLSLSHLHKLDVRGCEGVTYRSLVHVSKASPNLQELNLANIKSLDQIGDIGAFTDGPLVFTNLSFLNLSGCINLVKLLLQAPNLHYLNIENCSKLTDQMLDGVIEHSENLQKLVLGGCRLISAKEWRPYAPAYPANYWLDFEEIQSAPIVKILKSKDAELGLGFEEIDTSPQGLGAFAKVLKLNKNLTNLTSLNLRWNKIGAFGVQALAQGNLTHLTSLNLGGNDIGDSGVQALAQGNLTNLTSLDLGANKIGSSEARVALKKRYPNATIRF